MTPLTFPIFSKAKSLAIFLLLIVVDQASKHLAIRSLPTVCNTGSAFGLPISNVYVTVGVLLIVALVILKNRKTAYNFPLVLIFGGGLSNLGDRIFRGCVLDFVDLKFWPSFNLADSAITIGVAILIFQLVGFKARNPNDLD